MAAVPAGRGRQQGAGGVALGMACPSNCTLKVEVAEVWALMREDGS